MSRIIYPTTEEIAEFVIASLDNIVGTAQLPPIAFVDNYMTILKWGVRFSVIGYNRKETVLG